MIHSKTNHWATRSSDTHQTIPLPGSVVYLRRLGFCHRSGVIKAVIKAAPVLRPRYSAHAGQCVTDTAIGVNQFLRKPSIYLAAQCADVDINDIGQPFEGRIPYMLQDHGSGNRTIHVPDQVFQEQKLFRPQIDRFSKSRCSTPDQVQFKITRAKHADRIRRHCIGGGLAKPYRKGKAHGQLGSEERLTNTIVRTGFEQSQPLLQIEVPCKDKQGHIGVFLPQQPHQQNNIPEDQ
jgi:hypothetical protein